MNKLNDADFLKPINFMLANPYNRSCPNCLLLSERVKVNIVLIYDH